MYHIAVIVSGKSIQLCKSDNICVVESSKSSSVMPAVHMHNFESISMAEIIILVRNHTKC